MYPGTDNPNYTERFDSFSELTQAVVVLDETLNQILSWGYYLETLRLDEFGVLIFMPRKGQTTYFMVLGDHEKEAQVWVESYLRNRATRYFDVGWRGGGE